MRSSRWFAVLLACWSGMAVRGDERLAGIACRSVHLSYRAPEGVAFYNEIDVSRSAEGTYFCAAGFSVGYMGIQELGGGRKVAIFSVWDPAAGDDPDRVAEDRRVRVLDRGEGVRISRFGNEGTGGKSMLDLDWKVDQPCRFLLTARPDGDRTEYTAHVSESPTGAWRKMASFSTLARGKLIDGHYAFIEDFKRDRESATQPRRARFGPGWVRSVDGKWSRLDQARFTADGNPSTAIDAGVDEGRFYLATGGGTTNLGVKLGDDLPSLEPEGQPPADLPLEPPGEGLNRR